MNTMNAIVFERYGSPEVLQLKQVKKPIPKGDEVLVKVRAASINYGDIFLMRGKPYITRLMGYGIRKPKYKILGTDIAGQVEANGSNANQFQPGDEVYAYVGDCGFGAFAEYVAVPENELILKPSNLSYEQAAAVPQAAVVALQGLRDQGQIQPGQEVLIIGASGGIGTFAVQIAKALGATVTGVCSTRNIDLVRRIGADHVIDYTREDFTNLGLYYDLILDIVANRSLSDYFNSLKPNGRYVACAFNPAALFLGPIIPKKNGKHARSLIHKPNTDDLVFLRDLLETGKIMPVIGNCYPLSDLPDAVRHIEARQHFGKVVITVAH